MGHLLVDPPPLLVVVGLLMDRVVGLPLPYQAPRRSLLQKQGDHSLGPARQVVALFLSRILRARRWI